MDKISRAIIIVAIAIVYPVLMFFTASTVITEQADKPDYEYCQERSYNRYSGSYTTNYECQEKRDNYQEKYEKWQDNSQNVLIQRAILVHTIVLATIFGAYTLRKQRDVAAGLAAGAVFSFFATTGILLSAVEASQAYRLISLLLNFGGFILMIFALYLIERRT